MSLAARNQIRAADPDRSTWLSANAGSGKTRVLTDRVARLLLNQVPPQNILCLTYTKAAAGEMQNRLFRRLGDWAMKPDAELAAELAEIGVEGPVDAERLAQARRLFARAVETPGGLKIQTIHAFCAAILRQFPLEARVGPRFREIDDREKILMLRELFDELAEGPHEHLVAAFARHVSAGGVEAMLAEIVGHAAAFETPLDPAEIYGWFDLPRNASAEDLADRALGPSVLSVIPDLAAYLATRSVTSQKSAAALRAASELDRPEAKARALADALLTQKGEPRRLLLSDAGRHSDELLAAAEALVEAVQYAASSIALLAEVERNLDLHFFARAYVAAYRDRKSALGVLDFDDLIRRTLRLLSDSSMAEWVLFRLDGGIDHILVDEAQDTSPAQWRIIERLAQEFAAGAGRRADVPRTIFAVGDRKQSIYSFQGAAPAEFDRMGAHFSAQLEGAAHAFQSLELQHSFRSSPLLLDLVDRVFDGDLTSGVAEPTRHAAFFPEMPGRIDLWPLLGEDDADPLPEWWDASDRTSPRDAPAVLADRIAERVRRMVDTEFVPDRQGMREMNEGDVLILVRRRSFITLPLIQALKKQGLEVAGADQIQLASDLAVMDVVAVLKVLVTPADSLSLAASLRSPLFGLSEAQLFDLAHDRGRATLWEALIGRRDEFPGAAAMLIDLQAQADYLRPFELIQRLLVRHDGRRRLVARLGEEVEEALDVLLGQALAYETSEVPSLTGFIAWHEAEEVTVKRQAEAAGKKVRVMTVHGAKGLEAPVVILPDTADYAPPVRERLVALADGQPVFRGGAAGNATRVAAMLQAEGRGQEEEANRLLYVALTRAQSWLIVCGAGKDEKDGQGACWHRKIATAMARFSREPTAAGDDGALRLEFGSWPAAAPDRAQAVTAWAESLPGWAEEPAPTMVFPPPPLSPSGLGPMAHTGEVTQATPEDALRRGTQLHLLLEHLPLYRVDQWDETAAALLREGEEPADDAELADRLEEAVAVLSAPELAPLFGPDSLAEVDVTAALPDLGDRQIYGRIDRLVRDGQRILAVDFKSNRLVPDRPQDIPEGILMQLGAYLAALQQIFPADRVEVAVLWTRVARLMVVPDDIVLAALRRATTS